MAYNNTRSIDHTSQIPPYDPSAQPAKELWGKRAYEQHKGTNTPYTEVEIKVGNTWYTVRSQCVGTEQLTDQVKRMMFHDKAVIS